VSDIFGFPDEEPYGSYYDQRDLEEELYERSLFEDRYTLYGDLDHANESFTLTGPEWIGEAYRSQYETIELYGLSPLDIISDLIDAGYDYEVVSPITGELISGVWEDWRELYGEVA